jgi:hypothetical protein
MKRLFALLILCASCAFGQYTVPQHTGATVGSTGLSVVGSCVGAAGNNATTVTASIAPSNGNTLVAGLSASLLSATQPTFSSLQDNNSNNFTPDQGGFLTFSNGYGSTSGIMQWFHEASVSAVTSVKATFAANTYSMLIVCEVHDSSGTPSVDVSKSSGDPTSVSGTTWTAGSVTTSVANGIVFGLFANGSASKTFTASSPWTLAGSVGVAGTFSLGSSYQVTSTGSYSPVITPSSSGSGQSTTIAYKP